MGLSALIEAILFFRNEPVSVADLCRTLTKSEEEIRAALEELSEQLSGRGLALVRTETEAALATAPQAAELITALRKDELSKDLGKAGAETLAIILYEGPITRSEIDFIHGVNSSFIIRNLMIRGLIERSEEKGGRGIKYQATPDLLAHMGVSSRAKLPDFEKIHSDIAAFKAGTVASEAEASTE